MKDSTWRLSHAKIERVLAKPGPTYMQSASRRVCEADRAPLKNHHKLCFVHSQNTLPGNSKLQPQIPRPTAGQLGKERMFRTTMI